MTQNITSYGTATEARDRLLSRVMNKPKAERDAILLMADKLLDLVTQQPHALNALALANAELAALHEAGLLEISMGVQT